MTVRFMNLQFPNGLVAKNCDQELNQLKTKRVLKSNLTEMLSYINSLHVFPAQTCPSKEARPTDSYQYPAQDAKMTRREKIEKAS